MTNTGESKQERKMDQLLTPQKIGKNAIIQTQQFIYDQYLYNLKKSNMSCKIKGKESASKNGLRCTIRSPSLTFYNKMADDN